MVGAPDHDRKVIEMHDDYPVGYKRPPRHSQFKPGQSGNPKGRPRKQKSLATCLKEELYRVVKVTVNGKQRQMPLIEALVNKLVHLAVAGDARARRDLIGLTKCHPGAVRHQAPLRIIDETMSPQEAAAAYAETLRAIPGLIDSGLEVDLGGKWDER